MLFHQMSIAFLGCSILLRRFRDPDSPDHLGKQILLRSVGVQEFQEFVDKIKN